MLRLLGEVGVDVDGVVVDLGAARQRCVFAALALDVGRPVSVDQLIERVWGEDVPLRGRATLNSYLSRLRQALCGVSGLEITRTPGGYRLSPGTAVDVAEFRRLCAAARTETDPGQTVRGFTDALALWRGEALAGLAGEWAAVERVGLEEERVTAQRDLADARLRAGCGEVLVAELGTQAAHRPFDERLAGQYMLALHQAGRTADALSHYLAVRERLIDELGSEPGTQLQQLHIRLLAAGAEPTARPGTSCRQLPRAPRRFVGRTGDLAALDLALTGGPVIISALAGAGGIGKTWLALHWAHLNAHRFPDGQLFVDLLGFHPDQPPMTAGTAIRGFLDALGVEPARIPTDTHAATALFRKLTAGKRFLVVLDNAADSGQVAPLLPDSDTCAVLVTSRGALTSLVARHGAHHLSLNVLTNAEARTLLADRVGTSRAAAEPGAVDRVIELCGGFPLALSLAAAQVQMRPELTLTALAAELLDLGPAALADADPAASLPAVLSLSLKALAPREATAYQLLGIAPGGDIGLDAAANLLGLPRAAAADVLRALTNASLVSNPQHGRYRMHDLIRRHAAAQEVPDEMRTAALDRVVDFYLHTAVNADAVLNPARPSLGLAPPVVGCTPLAIGNQAAAMDWFAAEHDTLLATQQLARHREQHQATWGLAAAVEAFLHRRGYLRDKLTTWTAGAEAVAHLADPTAHVLAYRLLGRAHADLGNHEQADRALRHALAVAEEHGDVLNQHHTHRTLAAATMSHGDSRQARSHAERALLLARQLDNPVWEPWALNAIGWYAAKSGDTTAGLEHCDTALTLFRQLGDAQGQATTLDSLGYIAHQTGRPADAIEHYRAALRILREIGSTSEEADTLNRLGHVHTDIGEHREAGDAWRQALALYEHQGRSAHAEEVRGLLGPEAAHRATTTRGLAHQ